MAVGLCAPTPPCWGRLRYCERIRPLCKGNVSGGFLLSCELQRRMQPPTGGGLSWRLTPLRVPRRSRQRSSPLRGGHGGGLCPFVVVTVEVFFTPTQKQRKKIASHVSSAFLIAGTCLGFAPLRGTCAARRLFRRNRRRRRKISRKKNTSTGRGRWSCGGLRRAALEVTAVFCRPGRWSRRLPAAADGN